MEKPTAKIIENCKHCNKKNRFEVELSLIFDALEKNYPSAKGPIDSIKAILEKKKPILQRY